METLKKLLSPQRERESERERERERERDRERERESAREEGRERLRDGETERQGGRERKREGTQRGHRHGHTDTKTHKDTQRHADPETQRLAQQVHCHPTRSFSTAEVVEKGSKYTDSLHSKPVRVHCLAKGYPLAPAQRKQ